MAFPNDVPQGREDSGKKSFGLRPARPVRLSRREGTAFLVGDSKRPEFAPIARHFRRRFGSDPLWTLQEFSGGGDFFRKMEEADFDRSLVVLLESFPGEFLKGGMARFRRRFPLVPILLIAGPLCEGEGRTGEIPPGVIRYYWDEWDPVLRDELERFLIGRPGRFSLPPTTLDEDYFRSGLANAPLSIDPSFDSSLDDSPPILRIDSMDAPSKEGGEGERIPDYVVLETGDVEMTRLLLDLATKEGESVGVRTIQRLLADEDEVGTPQRILIDSIEPEPETLLPVMEELHRKFPDARIDLFLFSPRPEEKSLFEERIPRLRVFPKPFDLRVLLPMGKGE